MRGGDGVDVQKINSLIKKLGSNHCRDHKERPELSHHWQGVAGKLDGRLGALVSGPADQVRGKAILSRLAISKGRAWAALLRTEGPEMIPGTL